MECTFQWNVETPVSKQANVYMLCAKQPGESLPPGLLGSSDPGCGEKEGWTRVQGEQTQGVVPGAIWQSLCAIPKGRVSPED